MMVKSLIPALIPLGEMVAAYSGNHHASPTLRNGSLSSIVNTTSTASMPYSSPSSQFSSWDTDQSVDIPSKSLDKRKIPTMLTIPGPEDLELIPSTSTEAPVVTVQTGLPMSTDSSSLDSSFQATTAMDPLPPAFADTMALGAETSSNNGWFTLPGLPVWLSMVLPTPALPSEPTSGLDPGSPHHTAYVGLFSFPMDEEPSTLPITLLVCIGDYRVVFCK
ncbi:hypothetical protein ASPWEDRAFT_168597 [Aspergillus wentii DTO 134E9]|uniref:Uncharacterized protein n=1 Tax=Aspergillus wentii DTO 134E9 TaxID=1073089 RepID=A0A1L9RUY0_ASPWE|nr:uncharacterized protein ASPWEDRAFT_168597 [Aspergillus wentii DTO 134E9]OJJ38703.1 hypothetical protein ASPWEDRAFT_168597 [Aspergillus wentii DTO 134E9]